MKVNSNPLLKEIVWYIIKHVYNTIYIARQMSKVNWGHALCALCTNITDN